MLVVALRRSVRRHTALASDHGVGMVSRDGRPMVVHKVRLAGPYVLLVVQWVAAADVDGLVLGPRRLSVLACDRVHKMARLVVRRRCPGLGIMGHAQRGLLDWLVGVVHVVLMLAVLLLLRVVVLIWS